MAAAQVVIGVFLHYVAALADSFNPARQPGDFIESCLTVEAVLWVIAAVVYVRLPRSTPVARWPLAHLISSLPLIGLRWLLGPVPDAEYVVGTVLISALSVGLHAGCGYLYLRWRATPARPHCGRARPRTRLTWLLHLPLRGVHAFGH